MDRTAYNLLSRSLISRIFLVSEILFIPISSEIF
jgi:hypothetical protein